ncbi:hypothetical protein C1646_704369 [Rhizophagus diaphanus]|nr:hypothetical protein C1646_704369 [Rhizophagus diaphanus] [Rhizophagus sp. MUCL 43196]
MYLHEAEYKVCQRVPIQCLLHIDRHLRHLILLRQLNVQFSICLHLMNQNQNPKRTLDQIRTYHNIYYLLVTLSFLILLRNHYLNLHVETFLKKFNF